MNTQLFPLVRRTIATGKQTPPLPSAYLAVSLAAILLLSACAIPAEAEVSPDPYPGLETGMEMAPSSAPSMGDSASEGILQADSAYPAPENAENPPSHSLPDSQAKAPPKYIYYYPLFSNISMPFRIQDSGMMNIQGINGCYWAGVAGQVFDLNGTPFQNLVVHLEGTWFGKHISLNSLSGSVQQYGPAGFQFVLGSIPADTQSALWVQMRDANAKEISERIYLTTYKDCARNLVLVNFIQIR